MEQYPHGRKKLTQKELKSWWKWKSVSDVQLFATPWTVAHWAPLSMEFSREEYWSGLPFPSPGDLPNPEIEPRSSTLQAASLPSEPRGKPYKALIHKWVILFNFPKDTSWQLTIQDQFVTKPIIQRPPNPEHNVLKKVKKKWSRLVMSNSLQPHGH